MVNAKCFKGPSMGRMRCTRMMLLFLGPVIKKVCLERNIHLIDYYQLKPSKCIFLQTSVKFLGHEVSEEGISRRPY